MKIIRNRFKIHFIPAICSDDICDFLKFYVKKTEYISTMISPILKNTKEFLIIVGLVNCVNKGKA